MTLQYPQFPFPLLRVVFGWLVALAGSGCGSTGTAAPPLAENASKAVRVVAVPGGFRLERQGHPYRIRGAGGTQHLGRIGEAGGNSVRLWSTDYAGPLLDEAQKHGLTVMLGLWMEPDGKGVDYYDRTAVQAQLQRLRTQVLLYRNHPALLMWNVGNELDLLMKLNPKVFIAMNEVALMIHELDPNHPVTSSMTGTLGYVAELHRWAPAIDILSVNSYAGLLTLPETVRKSGWTGPYIVTEFGAKGFWEVEKTPWHAPIEQNSSIKAAYVAERYRRTVIADSAHCLGAYVFFWGTKMECTLTWFSLFTSKGEKTALVDTMQHFWKGKPISNYAPAILRFELAGSRDVNFPRLHPDTDYPATVVTADFEGDSLTADWEVWPEASISLVSAETSVSEPLSGYISHSTARRTTLHTPRKPGAYRLMLWLHDGHGGAATANIPFYCTPNSPQALP